jgi:hypothetical protein
MATRLAPIEVGMPVEVCIDEFDSASDNLVLHQFRPAQ